MSEASEDPILRKGYAYHEAGHAVLEHYFGFRILGVSIKSQKGGFGGVTKSEGLHPVILDQMGVNFEGSCERAEYYSHRIMIQLAGEIAQKEYCPESVLPHHSSSDRLKVNLHIKEVVTIPFPNEREEMVLELYQKTRELLTLPENIAAIRAVAEALQEHKELTGEQATKIIREAITAIKVENNTAKAN